MAEFLPAFHFLMSNETFTDSVPSIQFKETIDSNGGAVIAGVNQKSWPEEFQTIQDAEPSKRGPFVEDFYRKHYWLPMRLGALDSQDVATRVLDMAVNSNPQVAVRILQKSCIACGKDLQIDGVVGPITIHAANAIYGAGKGASLLSFYRSIRVQAYRRIASTNPAKYNPYLKEWIARAEK